MSDPVGLAGSSGAGGAGGVRPGLPGAGAGKGAEGDKASPSFGAMLRENIERVNDLQRDATTAVTDLQTGRRDDLEGVLLATQKADTAFRTLLAVRGKVLQAYEEIKQIRV